jgi:hypothetical protein
LEELGLENCPLTFLVVFALLVLFEAFYHVLLFADLFLNANREAAFDEVPGALLKISKPGVDLPAFGSAAFCGFQHGLGNSISCFFLELFIL